MAVGDDNHRLLDRIGSRAEAVAGRHNVFNLPPHRRICIKRFHCCKDINTRFKVLQVTLFCTVMRFRHL